MYTVYQILCTSNTISIQFIKYYSYSINQTLYAPILYINTIYVTYQIQYLYYLSIIPTLFIKDCTSILYRYYLLHLSHTTE